MQPEGEPEGLPPAEAEAVRMPLLLAQPELELLALPQPEALLPPEAELEAL